MASRLETLFFLYGNNKVTDQSAHPQSLINALVIRFLDCLITILLLDANFQEHRVELGTFGHQVKFGQRPCLFHVLIIGIKNKSTKRTVKIIRSRLIWISLFANVCPILPHVRSYLTIPYYLIWGSTQENLTVVCKQPMSRDMRFPTIWYVRPAYPQSGHSLC